jgi:hypothetical protein
MPELTITSPFVHFRVDSQHIYHGHWGTICQSRLYPPVRDFGFGLRKRNVRKASFNVPSTSGIKGMSNFRIHCFFLFYYDLFTFLKNLKTITVNFEQIFHFTGEIVFWRNNPKLFFSQSSSFPFKLVTLSGKTQVRIYYWKKK